MTVQLEEGHRSDDEMGFQTRHGLLFLPSRSMATANRRSMDAYTITMQALSELSRSV